MRRNRRPGAAPGVAGELRPELHRYCAPLMGSVIDGEDVVQDTFARLRGLDEIDETTPLRAWLFGPHTTVSLDLLRSPPCGPPSDRGATVARYGRALILGGADAAGRMTRCRGSWSFRPCMRAS